MIGQQASFAVADAIGDVRYPCLRLRISNRLYPQKKAFITCSPVAELKSIKNSTEIEGFRQSHIRDGAALARYFSWLEEQLDNGVVLNESQAADQLEKFRSYVRDAFVSG